MDESNRFDDHQIKKSPKYGPQNIRKISRHIQRQLKNRTSHFGPAITAYPPPFIFVNHGEFKSSIFTMQTLHLSSKKCDFYLLQRSQRTIIRHFLSNFWWKFDPGGRKAQIMKLIPKFDSIFWRFIAKIVGPNSTLFRVYPDVSLKIWVLAPLTSFMEMRKRKSWLISTTFYQVI